ncbi:MAG: B12-binding domain-containing radical SAM protein, partial [Candidatus Omnitrophota bacterium]|nr:B12-binding domain-containing radical SAM protein [Candidatus Omnitrophota bacterium]
MKIALLDLNHNTRGIHTNTAPYALGLIACYLQKNIDHNFDIKIFKDTDKALDTFASWMPDVLGISQYLWNSELNLYVAGLIKQKNPKCFIVAGGPNLDFSSNRRLEYFKKNPFVDICVPYDGEIPFTEIIRRILSRDTLAGLRKNPVLGSYALDYESKRVVDNVNPAPRLNNIDVFGSIYADGFFDEFLNNGFHPHIQTHRGCPFQCTYCHTSDNYYSKMLFLSPEIFQKEMDYLGKRFQGQHNVTLYMGNTNMTLFKEDFSIAEIIRQTQDKYDWPKIINVNCGKDPDKLLKMLSIIKFEATVSLQTLTPKVLQIIKRKNIPLKNFVSFMQEVSKITNEMLSTDLILCLPKETKKTFLLTLKKTLNAGIENIVVYTLMNLKGTELASEKFCKRYKYQIRHRVVPRQFSQINKDKVLDTEEVVVATSTLSFKDYIDLRGLTFTVTAYLSAELIPLKRLLREHKINISDWVFGIHEKIKKDPDTRQLYKDFIKETKKELFSSRQALLKFFNKEENFQALC